MIKNVIWLQTGKILGEQANIVHMAHLQKMPKVKGAFPIRRPYLFGQSILKDRHLAGHTFRVRVVDLFDPNQVSTRPIKPAITLSVFVKQPLSSANLITSFTCGPVSSELTKASTAPCRTVPAVVTRRDVYEGIVTLNPAQFNNPNGYLIVLQNFRVSQLPKNLEPFAFQTFTSFAEVNPARVAATGNGNSTPVFRSSEVLTLCVGDAYAQPIAEADPDGNELRFSLTRPYNSVESLPGSVQYNFAAGYSLTNLIPGNPALRIDVNSGVLSINPTETGYYTVTVLCEELRNGQRLSASYYTLPVYVRDCQKITEDLAKPIISADGRSDSPVAICGNELVTLRTGNGPYTYEWRRNTVVLPGQTSSTLIANEPGNYAVTTNATGGCSSQPSQSDAFVISTTPTQELSIQAVGRTAICDGLTTQLEATVPADISGNWFWTRNGQRTGSDQQQFLTVDQPGTYTLGSDWQTNSCVTGPSAVVINQVATPSAVIALSTPTVCQGDSYELTAQNIDPANTYTWFDEAGGTVGTGPVLTTNQSGDFTLRVVTPAQCEARATVAGAQLTPVNELRIMSLQSTICQGNALTANVGNLTGYSWTRDGIPLPNTSNVPSLTVSQTGTYALTSTFPACTRLQAPVQVTVNPLPTLTVSLSSQTACQGDTYRPTAQTDQPIQGNQLAWSNAAGTLLATGTALSTTQTGPFTLRATTTGGHVDPNSVENRYQSRATTYLRLQLPS